MGKSKPKRVNVFDAKAATGYSSAILVADYDYIVFTHSTIAASDHVVKLQGGSSTTTEEMTPPTFSSAKAVDNEWDYLESHDLQDTSSAIAGDTGVTFAGADVRRFTANTEGVDYISFHVSTYSAGALDTNVTAYQR